MGTLDDILRALKRHYGWGRKGLRHLQERLGKLSEDKQRALLEFLLSHREFEDVDVYGAFYALRNQTLYGFLVDLLYDAVRGSIDLLELLLIVNDPYSGHVWETKRKLLELPPDWGGCCNFAVGIVEWTEEDFLENSFEESGLYRWVSDFGAFVSRRTLECSVGTVRKMRSGVVHEDRTCGTCPYFIPREMLLLALEAYETKDPEKLEVLKRVVKKRRIKLFGGDV